jgi:hypothetical protein
MSFIFEFINIYHTNMEENFTPLSPEIAQLALKMLLVEHSITQSNRRKTVYHSSDVVPDSKNTADQAT